MKTLLSLTFLSFLIDKATINTHKQSQFSLLVVISGESPLIFRPKWDLKVRKKFLWDRPLLISGHWSSRCWFCYIYFFLVHKKLLGCRTLLKLLIWDKICLHSSEAEPEEEFFEGNDVMDSCASADGGDSDDDFLESSNGNGVPEGSSPDQQQEEQSSDETVKRRNCMCHM